jgi:hypothetical protein
LRGEALPVGQNGREMHCEVADVARQDLLALNGCRDRTASCDGLIDVVELLISAAIASADTKRRQPMTTLGRLPARNIA